MTGSRQAPAVEYRIHATVLMSCAATVFKCCGRRPLAALSRSARTARRRPHGMCRVSLLSASASVTRRTLSASALGGRCGQEPREPRGPRKIAAQALTVSQRLVGSLHRVGPRLILGADAPSHHARAHRAGRLVEAVLERDLVAGRVELWAQHRLVDAVRHLEGLLELGRLQAGDEARG